MTDEEALCAMKNGANLINCSRGELVDNADDLSRRHPGAVIFGFFGACSEMGDSDNIFLLKFGEKPYSDTTGGVTTVAEST